MFSTPLTGIVPPLVTPLLDHDTLDAAGLERLIERVIGGGVSGLFVLGTTGEGPCLSYRLRREVISHACRCAKGRVPVLVGVTDPAVVETLSLARYAADIGAAAVVAAPPYYLSPSPGELTDYVRRLLPQIPLPLFLYNMPSLTKISFELDTVRRLTEERRICGVKDSSGDIELFRRFCELRTERPDWTILIGPEERLFDAVVAGGHGGVNGGANLFPRLYVALYRAAASGDLPRARELQTIVQEVSDRLYSLGTPGTSVIKGLKCALALEGVCADGLAEPFERFGDEKRQRIQAALVILRDKVAAAVSEA